MDRSPSSQSPYSMMDWMRPYMPSRCEVCGRPLAPSGTDWASQLNQWYTTTYAPLMDNLTRMWSTMAQPWMAPGAYPAWPGTQPQSQPHTHPYPHMHHHPHEHHHDCGCEHGDCDDCHGDQCHCRCCITDADLVVYARVGERRLVPLTLENPRRRERKVKLELSNWSSHGGRAGHIKSEIVGPVEFTLAPCHEHQAILLIEAAAATEPAANAPAPAEHAAEHADVTPILERKLTDVDDCQVFYADLRVEGCDIRPVRIALALLPRDCASHKVECGCSCC